MHQGIIHFPELFFRQVERLQDRVALRNKDYGIWKRVSWNEYGRMVRQVAAGLMALGVERGDRVSILGENRPEWLICHIGTMSSGAVTCGVYPTSASDQVAYVVGHSESKVLFIENEEQVDKVLQILPDLEKVKQIIIWDPKGLWGFTQEKIIFFDQFIKEAQSYLDKYPRCVEDRMSQLEADDTAMIIYTSGTTGRPKGAMISHRNILGMTESFIAVNKGFESDEVVSYLPLAHIYENLISLFQAIWSGCKVNFVESIDTLPENLREVSPTVFASVPRIWEKFASMIEIRMSDSTILKKALYRLAVGVGMKYVRSAKGSKEHHTWALLYWPLYWLVLYHLRRQLGFERVRLAICGAAPASPELFEFYNAIGVPLREGYGQTESTGVIALQRLERPRWGFVGEPIPGVEVKIAEDGEILARGVGVFKGYLKDPDLTAETIKDGWLHTGDVGMLDEGYLKIMDRKKDILITAGGKNITPAYIENKLKFSPYIQDAVVIGDGRKFLVALILIDEDNINKYAQDNRIPFTTFESLTQNPEVVKLVDQEVTKVNKTLSQVESIKKFALLPRRFYEEDGDVTPTKKVKRRFLEKRYADLIESLYKGRN
ncbi:MAG: fatty-acid--CoA ligase [Deltaproteobacteria bacterium RBG_13_43_22]|nr:MAG: fatty-acid--CoA ligase [Deltaproteobacteria bacterium RBG_13_43_22]